MKTDLLKSVSLTKSLILAFSTQLPRKSRIGHLIYINNNSAVAFADANSPLIDRRRHLKRNYAQYSTSMKNAHYPQYPNFSGEDTGCRCFLKTCRVYALRERHHKIFINSHSASLRTNRRRGNIWREARQICS